MMCIEECITLASASGDVRMYVLDGWPSVRPLV